MTGRPGQHRHHFYYWRLRPDDRDAAVAAMRRWQVTLASTWPDLAARLYLRCESERCTLMESYDLGPSPIEALADQLRVQGDAASAPWRQGPRQLEAFAEAA